jgi:hypothetical protein
MNKAWIIAFLAFVAGYATGCIETNLIWEIRTPPITEKEKQP